MTRQRIARIMTALVFAAASFQIGMSPAHAAALTDVSWSTSKAHPGDTGVRYSWSFTTATAGTVGSVTFSVPSGTAGATLTVVDNYGIGAGSAALSGTTVTYTVTTPASIASGIPVLITIDGFTNTSTAGSYSSTVTTRDTQATPATIDTATSNSVTFDSNTTALTVVIARTLAFTNNTDTILFLMDPTLAALADRSHTGTSLTVATNAANGYTLSARASDLTGSTETIARATAGTGTGVASASFPLNTWGFAVPAPTNGGTGTLSRSGQLAVGDFVGHTSTDQSIVANNGPTNGDTVPVTTRAKIDYLQPAVTYNSTITYTAVPSY